MLNEKFGRKRHIDIPRMVVKKNRTMLFWILGILFALVLEPGDGFNPLPGGIPDPETGRYHHHDRGPHHNP